MEGAFEVALTKSKKKRERCAKEVEVSNITRHSLARWQRVSLKFVTKMISR